MEKKVTFTLPDKKVMVVPVRRKGQWLPEGHAAAFLHGQSYWEYPVKREQKTGILIDPLTDAERKFFESVESNMALDTGDLSKRDQNYWTDFKVRLRNEVKVLDLSKPEEYIIYKVLLTNDGTIAPSEAEKFGKGTYKFAIVEEGYQNIEKVKSAGSKMEAYKFFGKIESSPTKMKEFLNVYYTQKPGGKSVPSNAKQEFLIAEIEKVIEVDLSGFLTLANDKEFEKKVLIYSGLKFKAILREGMNYKTPEGTIMGVNLQEAIAFLDNPSNSDEVIRIKGRIETAA